MVGGCRGLERGAEAGHRALNTLYDYNGTFIQTHGMSTTQSDPPVNCVMCQRGITDCDKCAVWGTSVWGDCVVCPHKENLCTFHLVLL